MRAHEACRKAPVMIDAAATIREAAATMDRDAVGALVVTDEGRPVGIVTDRDLTVRALARGEPLDGRIDSVMSTDLVTFDADGDLHDALMLFSQHPIRRLPLVRDGRFAGMLTLDDVVVDLISDLTNVSKAMAAQVLFGHAETPLPAAQPSSTSSR